MKAVVENDSGRKVFYSSRGNLWEIPMKTAICNTFTNQFITVVLQRCSPRFLVTDVCFNFPECLFPGTYFNGCFCPYRMKLPSFCSLLTNSAFTHFFFALKFSYNILNITHIFLYFLLQTIQFTTIVT